MPQGDSQKGYRMLKEEMRKDKRVNEDERQPMIGATGHLVKAFSLANIGNGAK